MASSNALSSALPRSSTTDCLPRFSQTKLALSPCTTWSYSRAKSPSGRSTLMTRAPASASRQVHCGAATACSTETTRIPESGSAISVRPRQAEHMLSQIRQDHVGRDRRHQIEPCFTKLALDIVFLGKAETAVGLHAHVGGGPGGVSGEQFRHVGFRADVLTGIVFARSLVHHQFGSTHLRISASDRELHALVLPDRSPEQRAIFGILRRLGNKPLGVADAFRSDQNSLGVHARKDVTEPLALLTNQVFCRLAQIVEEDLRRGVIHHGTYRIYCDVCALRQPHVHQKHRKALGTFFCPFLRGGACEQQHQIGMLGARGPDLLTIDDVV